MNIIQGAFAVRYGLDTAPFSDRWLSGITSTREFRKCVKNFVNIGFRFSGHPLVLVPQSVPVRSMLAAGEIEICAHADKIRRHRDDIPKNHGP